MYMHNIKNIDLMMEEEDDALHAHMTSHHTSYHFLPHFIPPFTNIKLHPPSD